MRLWYWLSGPRFVKAEKSWTLTEVPIFHNSLVDFLRISTYAKDLTECNLLWQNAFDLREKCVLHLAGASGCHDLDGRRQATLTSTLALGSTNSLGFKYLTVPVD